jgi:hypothetical protein
LQKQALKQAKALSSPTSLTPVSDILSSNSIDAIKIKEKFAEANTLIQNPRKGSHRISRCSTSAEWRQLDIRLSKEDNDVSFQRCMKKNKFLGLCARQYPGAAERATGYRFPSEESDDEKHVIWSFKPPSYS